MANTPDFEVSLGEGWDNLSKLEQADRLFLPLGTQAVGVMLEAVKEESQPYPEQPSRDRAKTFNTYVRGRGQYPRSAFASDANQPGGYRVKRTPKGRIRATSQQMDKRFRIQVRVEEDAIIGSLKNTASYSGWVLGSEDNSKVPHQVAYHRETGWVAKETAITRAKPTMDKAMDIAIGQFLAVLSGKD